MPRRRTRRALGAWVLAASAVSFGATALLVACSACPAYEAAASTPQTVTLDLVGAKSVYCYYRTPSGQWRRVAVGAGGTSLELSLQPGVTWISTIPNYTYGEYLAYVDSHEYVAYFPRGGTNSVGLAAGTYAVEWLRAETGQYVPQPALNVADGAREFTPPNNTGADWVLHLKRKQTP